MLDCFFDYIGIRVCEGDEPPASGLYINTLPGISLESIDKIANADQITYRQVWADAQAEAAQQFYTDFITELLRCFTINPYCDYEAMICANKKVLSNAWRFLLGVQLMQYRLYTTRLNRFTTVDLDDAQKLSDLYQSKYEDALHQGVLLCDTSTCCLDQFPNPVVKVWLP